MKQKNNQRKNARNYLIVGIFLAFLYLPLVIFPFVKNKLPADNSENRKLAEFPKLENRQDLLKFPSAFDAYWSDNLPFRHVIQQAYADANYNIFGVSTNSQVAVGKKDEAGHRWLFYNDIVGDDPLGDVRGTKRMAEQQKTRILQNIQEDTKALKKKGIDLYYAVAPNKSSLYTEYLPNLASIVDETSLADELKAYLGDNGVTNFWFLDEALRVEKSKGLGVLYKPLDTHWNEYGAFIGTKALLAKIELKFHGFDEYTVKQSDNPSGGGDLKGMMGLKRRLSSVDVTVETAGYIVSENTRMVKGGHSQVEVWENKKAYSDKTLMVVGDSFREAMKPWLTSVYRKVVLLHRNDYDPAMLETYSPDIVVAEAVERYIFRFHDGSSRLSDDSML